MLSTNSKLVNDNFKSNSSYGPRQVNLVLIAYASNEGSGEPAHIRVQQTYSLYTLA